MAYRLFTESVKESIQRGIYGRKGQIVNESILINGGWVTREELSLLNSLYSDYFGNWNDIWEEYDEKATPSEAHDA